MAFGPLEIFALIVVILALAKFLAFLYNPKFWLNNVVKPMFKKPAIATTIGLIITVVSLYYLIQYFTIVEIFAVMFFFMGITWLGMAQFSKEILPLATKLFNKKDLMRRSWLSWIIWLILIFWVLYALFPIF